jgi:hypothetical protein
MVIAAVYAAGEYFFLFPALTQVYPPPLIRIVAIEQTHFWDEVTRRNLVSFLQSRSDTEFLYVVSLETGRSRELKALEDKRDRYEEELAILFRRGGTGSPQLRNATQVIAGIVREHAERYRDFARAHNCRPNIGNCEQRGAGIEIAIAGWIFHSDGQVDFTHDVPAEGCFERDGHDYERVTHHDLPRPVMLNSVPNLAPVMERIQLTLVTDLSQGPRFDVRPGVVEFFEKLAQHAGYEWNGVVDLTGTSGNRYTKLNPRPEGQCFLRPAGAPGVQPASVVANSSVDAGNAANTPRPDPAPSSPDPSGLKSGAVPDKPSQPDVAQAPPEVPRQIPLEAVPPSSPVAQPDLPRAPTSVPVLPGVRAPLAPNIPPGVVPTSRAPTVIVTPRTPPAAAPSRSAQAGAPRPAPAPAPIVAAAPDMTGLLQADEIGIRLKWEPEDGFKVVMRPVLTPRNGLPLQALVHTLESPPSSASAQWQSVTSRFRIRPLPRQVDLVVSAALDAAACRSPLQKIARVEVRSGSKLTVQVLVDGRPATDPTLQMQCLGQERPSILRAPVIVVRVKS